MGAAVVTICDETPGGFRSTPFRLELVSERITVRELIRRRVQVEVEAYNRATPEYFQGLVQPTDAERVLNGYRLRSRRQLDWKEQFDKAIEGFASNGFFMVLDDRQLELLDEELVIGPSTEVRFIKLVQLVGG